MADMQTDVVAEKSTDRTKEPSRPPVATKTPEAPREESRSFSEAARENGRALESGFDTARDIAKRSAEATRRITENGRRASFDIAEVWRDAFDPLLKAHMELHRWNEQAWRQLTGFSAFPALRVAPPFAALNPATLFGLPPADVKETDEAYEVSLEAAGLAREDLELQIRDDMLVLAGCKADLSQQAGAAYRMSERRFGRFERAFPIPADADREGIEAAYADGVLTVTLPKTAQAARPGRRIEIR